MANITKVQRDKVEKLVINSMNIIDKSGTNGKYYEELFASMSDNKFLEFMKKELPFRFQYRPSVVEPTMDDATKALKHIGVPLMEKVTLPFMYEDKNGKAVTATEEHLVIYANLKKVQQFISKKNKHATEIANRDMRSGLLLSADKGSSASDREFESLATLGLENTMKEFSGPKADAMDAKNVMYNIIGTTGMVRQEDLPESIDDSLSRNMFNVYLLGAQLNSNLTNQGDYTMYTLKQKKARGVDRY